MRDKIQARIKAKFPDVNLSKKRLDAIADKLTPKITDENEIDAKLDDFNDMFPLAEIAKQDDKVRDLETKVKNIKPTEPGAQNNPDDKKTDTEVPAWAQPLFKELETLRTEKTQGSIESKVKSHDKLKGIPASFLAGRTLPAKEEDVDSYVDSIVKSYGDFKQEMANEGLLNTSVPVLGVVNKDGVSSEVQSYIESKTNPQKSGSDLGGKKI